MCRAFIIAGMLAFFSLTACEKVDQAFEAVDKVKTIKSDIEKKADEVKKGVLSKADEVVRSVGNEGGAASSSGEEKRSNKGEKEQEEDKED